MINYLKRFGMVLLFSLAVAAVAFVLGGLLILPFVLADAFGDQYALITLGVYFFVVVAIAAANDDA